MPSSATRCGERVVATEFRQLECAASGTFCNQAATTGFQGVPGITNTSVWQSLRVRAEFQMDVTSRLMVKLDAVQSSRE